MSTRLQEFETFLTRGSVEAAKILGMSQANYYSLKYGERNLPKYIRAHIDTIERLDADTLNAIVRDRLGKNGK